MNYPNMFVFSQVLKVQYDLNNVFPMPLPRIVRRWQKSHKVVIKTPLKVMPKDADFIEQWESDVSNLERKLGKPLWFEKTRPILIAENQTSPLTD